MKEYSWETLTSRESSLVKNIVWCLLFRIAANWVCWFDLVVPHRFIEPGPQLVVLLVSYENFGTMRLARESRSLGMGV